MIDFTENFVVIDEKHNIVEIDYDSGEESKAAEKAYQDAYKYMYAQWWKVCNENRALVNENAFLMDFKDKFEKKIHVLERQVAKMEDRIKESSAKLDRTQKNLKMLTLGSVNHTKFCLKVRTTEIDRDQAINVVF